MARVALQVKNVASMVLATAASVAWGFASRRFDSPGKSWLPAALLGFAFLLGQLLLLFVESKEEAELSLFRAAQLANLQEDLQLSLRIRQEIDAGNLELAKEWAAFRSNQHGK